MLHSVFLRSLIFLISRSLLHHSLNFSHQLPCLCLAASRPSIPSSAVREALPHVIGAINRGAVSSESPCSKLLTTRPRKFSSSAMDTPMSEESPLSMQLQGQNEPFATKPMATAGDKFVDPFPKKKGSNVFGPPIFHIPFAGGDHTAQVSARRPQTAQVPGGGGDTLKTGRQRKPEQAKAEPSKKEPEVINLEDEPSMVPKRTRPSIKDFAHVPKHIQEVQEVAEPFMVHMPTDPDYMKAFPPVSQWKED